MEKKRIVTSFEKLKPEIKELLRAKYPDGFQDDVMKVSKGPDSFFHAVTLDTPEISYLIKVEVKIDNLNELEESFASSYSSYEGEPKMKDSDGGEEEEEDEPSVPFEEDDYVD